MLSTPWAQRKNQYDFVIIGSGYGGAIAAARLAAANLNPKPSVCILERGKERQAGEFPETLADVIGEARSSANPLGLFELLNHPDISVIKGSGRAGEEPLEEDAARTDRLGEEQGVSGREDVFGVEGGRRRAEIRHRLDAVLEALVRVKVRGGRPGIVGGRRLVRPVVLAGLLGPRCGREEDRDHDSTEGAASERTLHLVRRRIVSRHPLGGATSGAPLELDVVAIGVKV